MAIDLDKISNELEDALERSRMLAEQRKQAQITPLHMLFVLLDAESPLAAVLDKSGIAVDALLETFATRLNTERNSPLEPGRRPTASSALRNLIEKSFEMMERRGAERAEPIDFIGLNIYTGYEVSAGPDGKPLQTPESVGAAKTMMDWTVDERCLYWGPMHFWNRYGKPIVITENGLAGMDWIALDGGVHDPQRIDYTRRHLRQLAKAAEDGAKVQGYLHWSFLDNFEWAFGYNRRFGLVYVDYATQRRVPKDSFFWYRDTIRANGANL